MTLFNSRWIRRRTYAQQPQCGDYVLCRTGVSWSVNRCEADGAFARLSEGGQRRAVAVQAVLDGARAAGTNAWQAIGATEYMLL